MDKGKADMANGVAVASRLLPLAATLAVILGAVPPATVWAAPLAVTDCGDGAAPGTLRNTIATASNGDEIDIPVACSTITLTQGALVIGASITDLSIVGQGPSATLIDASSRASPRHYNRAIASYNSGLLYLHNLTIAHAKYTGATFPRGGCIYAKNDVSLTDVVLTDCQSAPLSGSNISKGGAIYSKGHVTLDHSVVSRSAAANSLSQCGLGGGIYTKAGLQASFSTIADNEALGVGSHLSQGGGVYSADGDVTLTNSTISGNRADIGSAVHAISAAGTNKLSVISSTISGNTAYRFITADAVIMAVEFVDSTFAFNHAGDSSFIEPAGFYGTNPIKVYSSIFAENSSQTGTAYDIFSAANLNPLTGSNMLITATPNFVPLGTLASCPRLAHLSDNGGPTKTIPLLAGSPAIDAGIAHGESNDQRGPGFPRIRGNAADIGAFERTPGTIDDVIFFGEFETKCN